MITDKNQNKYSIDNLLVEIMGTTKEYDLYMILKKYSNDFNLYTLNILKTEFEKLQNQKIDFNDFSNYIHFSQWSIQLTDNLLQSIIELFEQYNISIRTKNNEDVNTALSELTFSNINREFENYFDVKKIYIDFYTIQVQRFLKLINENFSNVDLARDYRTINFNNNFNPNSFSANEVYSFFHKNLVIDKKVISEETLEHFLKVAFELKTPLNEQDKLPIEIEGFKKSNIIKVFYEYYIKSGKPHGRKPNYVRLLTDYFKGFKYDNVYSNFSK